MKIAYSTYSKFIAACLEAFASRGDQLSSGIEVALEPAGYDATTNVTILAGDAAEFETDWKGEDVTRFPVRIKAAATALRDAGYAGTFQITHKNGLLSIKRSDLWSEDELKASVEAYAQMMRLHHSGQKVVKTDYYAQLSKRFGRTSKAFEFRMQNISYVYSVMGRDWLPGLKPAKHVGNHVAAQLERLIAEVEGVKSAPVVAFETKVKELRVKTTHKPTGSETPSTTTVSITQYARDPAVKAWVLKNAEGHCECCAAPAPFLGVDGLPFLEVHHVRRLADGGADTPENAVALCPNCHREFHYGMASSSLVEGLYKKIVRLRKE